METCHIGTIIKHFREQAGISREDLAKGIVDPTTLWRIEEGHTMPSKRKIDIIFQKLNVNPNSLGVNFVSNEGAKLQILMDSLDSGLIRKNAEATDEIIAELEGNKMFMNDKHIKQLVMAAKVANVLHTGILPTVAIDMLKESMDVTWRSFCEDEIEQYFLTRVDFTIINMMALQYHALKEYERAANILYRLKKYIEDKCIDKIERGKRYPLVIFNLTNTLYKMGQYDDVIKLCDKGKEVCLDTGYLWWMPTIIYNKARSLYSIEKKDECEKLLREAYITSRFYGRDVEADIIKNYAARRNIVL